MQHCTVSVSVPVPRKAGPGEDSPASSWNPVATTLWPTTPRQQVASTEREATCRKGNILHMEGQLASVQQAPSRGVDTLRRWPHWLQLRTGP